MATLSDARDAVYKAIDRRIKALHASHPVLVNHFLIDPQAVDPVVNQNLVIFDNEKNDAAASGDNTWLEIIVRNFRRNQISIGPPGARRFRTIAYVSIRVHSLIGGATKSPTRVAELLAEPFDATAIDISQAGERTERLHFEAAQINDLGPGDGKWYVILAQSYFRYWQMK